MNPPRHTENKSASRQRAEARRQRLWENTVAYRLEIGRFFQTSPAIDALQQAGGSQNPHSLWVDQPTQNHTTPHENRIQKETSQRPLSRPTLGMINGEASPLAAYIQTQCDPAHKTLITEKRSQEKGHSKRLLKLPPRLPTHAISTRVFRDHQHATGGLADVFLFLSL